MALRNIWSRTTLSPERAMLLALSAEPQPVSVLAAKAGLSVSDASEALTRLRQEHFAIAEDGSFELTGPLSWFGDFTSAVKHYAERRFVVTDRGEPDSHLYVCDVRVKNARPVGDPLTETIGVFACGKTAQSVAQAADAAVPTCEDCRNTIPP